MNIVKVVDGKVIVIDERGRQVNTIVNHSALDADISKDGKCIAVISKDEKAILYNEKGQTICNLMNHSSKSVKISGDEIHITLKNRKINVYDLKGKYKKQI